MTFALSINSQYPACTRGVIEVSLRLRHRLSISPRGRGRRRFRVRRECEQYETPRSYRLIVHQMLSDPRLDIWKIIEAVQSCNGCCLVSSTLVTHLVLRQPGYDDREPHFAASGGLCRMLRRPCRFEASSRAVQLVLAGCSFGVPDCRGKDQSRAFSKPCEVVFQDAGWRTSTLAADQSCEGHKMRDPR